MKIIDLLNKIANGEIDRNNKYQFSRDDYCTIDDFFARYIVDEENLNLEIIEEKKIPEKLPEWATKREDKEYTNIEYHVLEVARKVDELIDYLKSKGE